MTVVQCMKQLLLFPSTQEQEPTAQIPEQLPAVPVFSVWKIFIDGASRNNPGPSGAGVYIIRDELVAHTYGVFLGKKTNNEAEYLALLLGVFELKNMINKGDLVVIVSDSQLLVRQISGQYKVKEPRLQQLYILAKQLLSGINYDIAHVLREDNKHADALANKGIDTKTAAPAHFIEFLQKNALSL